MKKEVPRHSQNKPAYIKVGIEEAARLHFEGGFNLTSTDMKRMFDASDSWIGAYWAPFVSHINYPCDIAKLWFSYDSFIKRYEENAIAMFQRHPEIRPGTSEEEIRRILRRAAVNRAKIPWESVELPRNKEGRYIIGCSIRRYQELTESILDENKDSGFGRSREYILRWFFLKGATKITIFGKVFWIVKDVDFCNAKLLCPPQTSRGGERPQP